MSKDDYHHYYTDAEFGWSSIREAWLTDKPWCLYCQQLGIPYEPAIVVDHVRPHKGDVELFRDKNNLQSLCQQCHDSRKQKEEKYGFNMAVDKMGLIRDPNHPTIVADKKYK